MTWRKWLQLQSLKSWFKNMKTVDCMFSLIVTFGTFVISLDEQWFQVCLQRNRNFFLSSGTSGAEGSSLAVCSSSLPPAVGILPVLPLPQRRILSKQGAPSSRHDFCPWGQQGSEPTVPSHRSLQGKTHQVRNVTQPTLLAIFTGIEINVICIRMGISKNSHVNAGCEFTFFTF